MELEDLEEELPQRLLRAWRDRDLTKFLKVLSEGCDVNVEFTDEKYQPILGVIARDEGKVLDTKQFTEAVLKAKDVDYNKQYASGRCAIHHAAEIANLPVLEALVESKANINALDQDGSTAIHKLVEKWRKDAPYRKCLELLMSQKDVNVNIINRKGYSAIQLAVIKNNKEAIVALLEKGSLLNIDLKIPMMDVSTRDFILKHFPDLKGDLPKDLGPEWSYVKMDGSQLFIILIDKEQERFCEAFEKEIQDKSQKGLLEYDNGKYTFLQYACLENLEKVVKCLMDHQANPNYTPHFNNESAMDAAVRKGYPEILKMLLDGSREPPDENPSGATPLHTVAKYCYHSPGHFKCLELLMDKKWDSGIMLDVNAKDCTGNTALHYAVLYSDNETISSILHHGGYIGIENKNGETPLMDIPHKVLEAFLDGKVNHIGAKQNVKEQFTFDYSFLAPPQNSENTPPEMKALCDEKGSKKSSKMTPETKPLLLMSQSPDHKHLLKHPVLTSFTYLKWQRIQAFFYTNLLFYLALCFFLTCYILFSYRGVAPVEIQVDSNALDEEVSHKFGPHDKINTSKPNKILSDSDGFDFDNTLVLLLRLIILIFIIFLFIRECIQFAISPKKYLKNYENYLELLLIILATYIVVNDCSQYLGANSHLSLICPQISALVILLSWIQLVLLIGKHPKLSIRVEMFQKVSVSFFNFLSWYILIIIAFALSFYVLFRGCSGDCKNPFTSPGTSLFKTLIMLSGELEASDIPFVSFVGTSHIIFTAFVFLIAIVLLNLLNGLAVADTKEIRDDVYLYSCVARVQLISFVEDFLFGDTTNFLRPCYALFNTESRLKFILLEYFAKKIVFFPKLLPEGKITVTTIKDGNIISFLGNDSPRFRSCISGYKMDNNTMRAARHLIEKRTASVEPQKDEIGPKVSACCEKVLTEKLADFEKRFKAIEQSNKQIEQLLIQHMAIVSLNHANEE